MPLFINRVPDSTPALALLLSTGLRQLFISIAALCCHAGTCCCLALHDCILGCTPPCGRPSTSYCFCLASCLVVPAHVLCIVPHAGRLLSAYACTTAPPDACWPCRTAVPMAPGLCIGRPPEAMPSGSSGCVKPNLCFILFRPEMSHRLLLSCASACAVHMLCYY